MAIEGEDDLDLLLSLQDRVLETPPSSPRPSSSQPTSLGYNSYDEEKRRRPSGNVDMSAFKSAVEDCMDYDVEAAKKALKSNPSKNTADLDVEKFSGLRIRNQVLSSMELNNQFSDIRFVRLTTIKNLIKGDTLSGCWATIGVLTDKRSPKTSSNGKSYCIWKIGCLDGQSISLFLFGDAYKMNRKQPAATVFAFFNATIRKDTSDSGFQMSVFNANQVLKIGTSVDYGVCKGRRKDGLPCTMVVNNYVIFVIILEFILLSFSESIEHEPYLVNRLTSRLGIYCSYHRVKTSEKYTVTRSELKGGNLRTAFKNPRQPEGIYMIDRLADRKNSMKPKKPTKVLSVDGLKKALSTAAQVTTNLHSQGIRFLNEMTVSMGPKIPKSENSQKNGSVKRSFSPAKASSSVAQTSRLPESKRVRAEPTQVSTHKPAQTSQKMIELEYISSDEDPWMF